jgi:DNA (cytosine-5)-methyltransferase 1
MHELSLFSGAGGGLLGTKLLGFTHIGYVENNDYCQQIIKQRIKDGILDEAPIFGDIKTFIGDGYADSYTGLVDVITAGFPCQPFSVAGKRKGENDDRNMWPETIECLRRIRPRYALLENVTGLLSNKYFGRILGELAESGFNAEWGVLSARDEGVPIERKRLFIACTEKINGDAGLGNMCKTKVQQSDRRKCPEFWLQTPPIDFGMEHGLANYVEQVSAIGNGQVPAVVKTAWDLLID